jgi:hypothetical protein
VEVFLTGKARARYNCGYWGRIAPGGAPGLQNQLRRCDPPPGGFDSHTLPPDIIRARHFPAVTGAKKGTEKKFSALFCAFQDDEGIHRIKISKRKIKLAESRDLKILAVGVETRAQLDFLSRLLCDEVQGFCYYQPVPAEEIEKY